MPDAHESGHSDIIRHGTSVMHVLHQKQPQSKHLLLAAVAPKNRRAAYAAVLFAHLNPLLSMCVASESRSWSKGIVWPADVPAAAV
jgi:hypothetical protein